MMRRDDLRERKVLDAMATAYLEGASPDQLAGEYDTSRTTITVLLRGHGVAIRDRAEHGRLRIQRNQEAKRWQEVKEVLKQLRAATTRVNKLKDPKGSPAQERQYELIAAAGKLGVATADLSKITGLRAQQIGRIVAAAKQ